MLSISTTSNFFILTDKQVAKNLKLRKKVLLNVTRSREALKHAEISYFLDGFKTFGLLSGTLSRSIGC